MVAFFSYAAPACATWEQQNARHYYCVAAYGGVRYSRIAAGRPAECRYRWAVPRQSGQEQEREEEPDPFARVSNRTIRALHTRTTRPSRSALPCLALPCLIVGVGALSSKAGKPGTFRPAANRRCSMREMKMRRFVQSSPQLRTDKAKAPLTAAMPVAPDVAPAGCRSREARVVLGAP